jgi:hydrogenase maturation factor HypF (carbamoyltransferase family)
LTPFLFSFKKGYKSDNALLLFIFSQLQQSYTFDTVVLSGGVFHNQLILKLVSELFESIGNITLLTHSKLPNNLCGA